MTDRDEAIHEKHRARIRRRIAKVGAGKVEDHVLLEAFLFSLLPRVDTNPASHALLERFGSVRGVLAAPFREIAVVPGAGQSCAVHIRRAYDRYFRKLLREPVGMEYSFSDAAAFFIRLTRFDPRVRLAVVLLDGAGTVAGAAAYRRPVPDGGVRRIVSAFSRSGVSSVVLGVTDRSAVPDLSGSRVIIQDVIEVSGFDARSVL